MENKRRVLKPGSYANAKHRRGRHYSISDIRELMQIWDQKNNVGILPEEIYYLASDDFWWLCPKCGHMWKNSPQKMVMGGVVRPSDIREMRYYGCPACRGYVVSNGDGKNSVAAIFPDIAELWDYEQNGDATPYNVVAKTGVSYWIKCKICGQSRKVKPRDAARAIGCQNCILSSHSSKGEQFIFANISKFFPCAVGNCRDILDGRELDIYVPDTPNGPFGIEYNGEIWHSDDEEKRKWKYDECKRLGITLVDVVETHGCDISVSKWWCDHVFETKGHDYPDMINDAAMGILRLMGIHNPEIIPYGDPRMNKLIVEAMKNRVIKQSISDSELHIKLWRRDMNDVDPSIVSANEKRMKFWFDCWNCGKLVLISPYYIGRQKYCRHCTPPNRPIPVEQWSADRKTLIAKFESAMDAERKLGFSGSYITAVTRGKHDLAYGFYWKKSDQYNR